MQHILFPLFLFLSIAVVHVPCATAQDRAGSAAIKTRITMITWRGMTAAEEGFKAGMLQLGQEKAKISHFDVGQDKSKLSSILEKISKNNTDVVYTFGTTVTEAAVDAVKDIPIVFAVVAYPVESGIMASDSGSGSNVAGVSQASSMADKFSPVQDIMDIKKVGVIFNPEEPNSVLATKKMKLYAESKGWTVVEAPVNLKSGAAEAANLLIRSKPDLVYLPPDSFMRSKGAWTIPLFTEHNIPTLGAIEGYAIENGALFGLSAPYYQVGSMAARMCREIICGRDPGTIPLGRPTAQLVINMRTARALGIKIPAKYLDGSAKLVR